MQEAYIKKVLIGVGAASIMIAVLLVLVIFRGSIFGQNDNFEFDSFGEKTEIELTHQHPLTGEALEEEIEDPRVLAVMVENMVEAWPLTGIDESYLVIEAPVEAAIPRLIAYFYEGQEVEKIGPVRSARPYYVDWAQELDALYAHVGGSPEALQLIASRDILDLNEFYNGWYFWRDDSRGAPHNVYTSTELLFEAYDDHERRNGVWEVEYDAWQFAEGQASPEQNGQLISMEFSPTYGRLYEARWKYDDQENKYLRYQNGELFTTTEGEWIWADNVVVIETEIEVVDAIGRRHIKTISEGDGLLFKNGEQFEVTWSKETLEDRIKFLEKETGEEITVNAGKTWIEVLPDLERVQVEAPTEQG